MLINNFFTGRGKFVPLFNSAPWHKDVWRNRVLRLAFETSAVNRGNIPASLSGLFDPWERVLGRAEMGEL
jgi:hypothetical protein